MPRDRLPAMPSAPHADRPYEVPTSTAPPSYAPVEDDSGYGYGYDNEYSQRGYGHGYGMSYDTSYDNYHPTAGQDDELKEPRISLGGLPGESTYELTSFSQPSATSDDQVIHIQSLLRELGESIDALGNLEGRFEAGQAAQQRAYHLALHTKTQIQQLATQVANCTAPSRRDTQTKSKQVEALRQEFKTFVQQFTHVEARYRNHLHQHGASFSSEPGQQSQYNVDRQVDSTLLTELSALVKEVDTLLPQSDSTAIRYSCQIEPKEPTMALEVKKGNKKRWICFWIVLVVIILVAVAVVATLCTHGVCNGKPNDHDDQS